MAKITFRDLRADEIEVRVSTISEKGCTLLLYKDARADMIILDETVGAENWQRRHTRGNANCVVSIWCEDKHQWIEKEDTGTESNTEKEKGLASDSFKRACTNWGIGRELYTAPFIWVSADKFELKKNPNNGRFATNDKFVVSEIVIENKKIIKLAIENQKTGTQCYFWSKPASKGNAGAGARKNQKAAEPPKSTQPTVTPLTEESKAALNTSILAYVDVSGLNINEVMAKLKEVTGKSHKQYTEEDARKALAVLKTMIEDCKVKIGA